MINIEDLFYSSKVKMEVCKMTEKVEKRDNNFQLLILATDFKERKEKSKDAFCIMKIIDLKRNTVKIIGVHYSFLQKKT